MPFMHEKVTGITVISVFIYELLSFDDLFFNESNIRVRYVGV